MPVYDSGRWRNDLAPKKSPATGSCGEKASAAWCGARMAGGWSVEGEMGW